MRQEYIFNQSVRAIRKDLDEIIHILKELSTGFPQGAQKIFAEHEKRYQATLNWRKMQQEKKKNENLEV